MKRILLLITLLLTISGCTMFDKNKTIKIDDLYTLTDDFGKTRKELGIDGDDYSQDVEGKLFGIDFKGYLFFSSNDYKSEPVFTTLSLNNSSMSFMECLKLLKTRCHGATDSGMEPYVASNGGAVEWYTFEDEKALIKLSRGSNNKYFTLKFTVNSNPSYCGPLNMFTDSASYMLPEGIDVKMTKSDDDVLSLLITNSGQNSCVLEEFRLFRKAEEDSYFCLNKVNQYLGLMSNYPLTVNTNSSVTVVFDLKDYPKLSEDEYLLTSDNLSIYFSLLRP